MSFFSLIIPVYNVEKYLAECLDSCINQTFKDIEIICINDCSPDNSDLILNKYAKKDSRIKIITHEKNKGLGGARNTGIAVATGKYSWFIDSDDYIFLNACEILNDIIEQFNADIIRFDRIEYSYDIFTKKKSILIQQPYSWELNKLFTKADYTKLEMPEISACFFISSTSLIKTLKFREGVSHEDNDFTPIIFSKAKTIFTSSCTLYFYRKRLGSITNNGITGLSQKRVVDSLAAIEELYKYITSEKLSKYHFCTRTTVGLCSYVKQEYKEYPDIHTKERDLIINKAESLGSLSYGDTKLYDNIIINYGNTKFLVFILKVYRYIIKHFIYRK